MTYRNVRHKLISRCFIAPFAALSFAAMVRLARCIVLLAGYVLLLGGCTEKKSSRSQDKLEEQSQSSQSSRRSKCPTDVHPRVGARIRADSLQEISGIVASRKSPGLFWLHNDSGDSARVYALEVDGRRAGSVELSRDAVDFEDIALERREGAPDRIYVADTGDNLNERKEGVFIHRFEEPTRGALHGEEPSSIPLNAVETMRLHFPDGPQDAEALLLDSKSGEIILITKPHMAPPEIYGVPGFTQEATLTHLGTITPQTSGHDFQIVTAADMSADGLWLLVRSYSDILAFPRMPGESISESLLGKGCRIPPAYENQGEAIAFTTTEKPRSQPEAQFPEFVTIGEGPAQALHFYDARAEAITIKRGSSAQK